MTLTSRRLPIKVDTDLMDRIAFELTVDSWRRAQAATWHRRAQTWDDAAPRPSDYPGRATPAELAERTRRCRTLAAACRAHALLLERRPSDPLPDWVVDALTAAPEWTTDLPGAAA